MENGGFPGLQEAEKVSSGCCVDWVNVMDLGMTSVILIQGIVTATLTIITTRRLMASVWQFLTAMGRCPVNSVYEYSQVIYIVRLGRVNFGKTNT